MSLAADLDRTTPDIDAATRVAAWRTNLVEHAGEATLCTFDDDPVLLIDGAEGLALDDLGTALAALRA